MKHEQCRRIAEWLLAEKDHLVELERALHRDQWERRKHERHRYIVMLQDRVRELEQQLEEERDAIRG